MSEDIRDMMTKYNPNAIDGDEDGFVQDATPYERPAGTDLTEDQLVEIEEETTKKSEDVITASVSGGSDEEGVLAPVANGAIGSTTRKRSSTKKSTKVAAQPVVEKAAVFADRNISWNGVGKITKGYNFVPVEFAEKWATIEGVRLLSPEEVARELG